MLEISPVLSGKFNDPAYVPAAVNFTSGGIEGSPSVSKNDAAGEIDTRRYTKFDRTASDAGSTTDFTFNDLLDLLNPIEHIPGISSALRSVHGDSIHPISRVAGDILFGGVLGLASAVFGAVGAVADSVSEASNGQDATGLVVTALLGGDSPNPGENAAGTLLAAAQPSPAVNTSASASAQTLAVILQSQAPMTQQQDAISSVSAPTHPMPSASPAPINADHPLALADAHQVKSYPLDRSKLPYGGVMAPAKGTQQEQSLALFSASHSPRIGSTLRTAQSAQHAATVPLRGSELNELDDGGVAPSTISQAQSSGKRNLVPQALVDDLMAMRAVQSYQSVAAGVRSGLQN